ncbi:Orn/Lys/Arg decarboxylase N-terminal domain-containing protein [Conexibacter sp. S30A1]|uniref:Orn/Lys/Arg family decarboxylase n=1 Tax=Conexibacter sp. S30A1 TaxID=2937800 RepID=UPI00200C8C9B|nr:Orn/Lys/Arg decarboxylase N-terminal domain-containing protein [Conexibacter sp. S30A1]
MHLLDSFPILLVDDGLHDDTAAGRATRALVEQLRRDGTEVITATESVDAEQIIAFNQSLSAVLVDWDAHHRGTAGDGARSNQGGGSQAQRLIAHVRAQNLALPLFVLADHSTLDQLPGELLHQINGYVWKLEDTPEFVARRIEQARRRYLQRLLPPFFGALVNFTEEASYSWHTPGHSGGAAFLKSPVGVAFHRFFGENTLRSDLSVSVGALGSLLEHSGLVGAAEAEAAQTFGAQRTMFVTNGTSTANKIVFHASVRPGDVVLVDRNCHKSIMHAIVMTGAIPVYLQPSRNAHGIIGPIPPGELTPESVQSSFAANPLVPSGTTHAALAVVTNSTYDGLCYDAQGVLDALSASTRRVLFDEAWFAYAKFHPLYSGRYATGVTRRPGQAATFATQSTHKLLTAFSQGSMLHLSDPEGLVNETALAESYMMHTSTSPQYGVIASLDVAAKMMSGERGRAMIDEAISEALAFRRELTALADACPAGDWCLRPWQPPGLVQRELGAQREAALWSLGPGERWHGYTDPGDGHVLLDPLKVTILTPGVQESGRMAEHGIPAALLSRFLDERGIVVEKTGSYSLLVLFSLGITKGKWGTLLAELLEFKRLYDSGAQLAEAMPQLVAAHPQRYGRMTLRGLADALHAEMRAAAVTELQGAMYAELPEPATTPALAFEQLVAGSATLARISELPGQVSAAMLVPYPPGIPVVMPGERFGDAGSAVIRYLAASEALDARFPGFQSEIHGIEIQTDGSYRIPCLSSAARQPAGDRSWMSVGLAGVSR